MENNYDNETFEHWLGADFDGTLVTMDEWRGIHHIGEPIWPMINIIKEHIKNGWKVKIVTARAAKYFNKGQEEEAKEIVADWTEKYLGQRLEVTSEKDYGMRMLYDDRVIQVVHNTGEIVNENVNHRIR